MDYNTLLLKDPDGTHLVNFLEEKKNNSINFLRRFGICQQTGEDIYQSVSLDFFNRHSEIKEMLSDHEEPEYKLRSYLDNAMTNKKNDYIRNFIRNKEKIRIEDLAYEPSVFHIPFDSIEDQELLKLVREEVDKLPYDLHSVIAKKYYHDLMRKDIAEIDGVTEETVDYRKEKALSILRIKLQDAV